MSLGNLESLAKIGHIQAEGFNEIEYLGLIRSGCTRLSDAKIQSLSQESRFDLAYNAAHAFALAALRKCHFRPKNRYIVFQAHPMTTGLGPEVWRILSKCHDKRNLAEYEGHLDIDEQLLDELINACEKLRRSMDEI